ncbi:Ig-like domain-containing protein [Exiguobacterium profundum]|uniref:Ig-like domain-containing protein n=1 Tax=Exiguobacterium TaxID=33986 RepID=UPI001BFCA96B|nr:MULTISPECIES: Ig-like domain-containing protein [Exiguobacterium]MCT4797831.1 Ig-like domain-containing protein [Exiguobacterium profundum]
MAKKKQFVTAAAAFAVAASAVAPAITADAASTTVQLSSDYVRGGDLDAALDKEYKGSEIYWYKSSVDMNKLGVFQTAKGFVKGQGIRVEKKLRVLNHAQDIQPEEIVLEEGVPASGLRIQPVLFADGVKYNKVVTYAGFSTEKAGEFEGTFTYSNKAFGVVTKTVKYKVVKSEVEISNVSSSVDQAAEVLSVTADVKNLKDGEKVELVVYPGKDMSATPIKTDATVKDGKLTVSQKLPAGTHSFQLVSGEVKSAVVDFTIEAPMVKEVKAINLEGFVVNFNKQVDKNSFSAGDIKIDNVNVDSTDLVWAADGKSVTIKKALAHGTVYRVTLDGLKTATNADVAKFESLVDVKDEVAPTVAKTSYSYASKTATIEFSEALANNFESGIRVFNKNGVDVTTSATITAATDEKSVTVNVAALSPADGDSFKVVMVGATDVKGNYFANNRVETSFINNKVDTVKPVVTSLVGKDQKTVRVSYTEAVDLSAAKIIVDGVETTIDPTPAAPSALVLGDAVKVDDAGMVWDVTVSSTNLTTTNNIGIKGATDTEGNIQDGTFNQFIKFVADTTAPTLVSSSTSGTKLILTFDEEVDVNAGAITLVKPGNVRVTTSAITPTVDKKVVTIDLGSNISEAGTYSVELALNMVEDAANNSKAYAVNASFATNDTGKPTLLDLNNDKVADANAVVQSTTNPGVFTIKFSEEVGNSALSLSNYLVNNQAIFEKAIFVGDKQTVELVAKPNTIDIDNASYLFTVSNVADLSGNLMVSETLTRVLKENVLPVVKSAKLTTTTTIALEYSETVSGDAAADFEVYVDGTKVTVDSYAAGVITLAGPVDPTKAITVKVVGSILDANGNAVASGATINVTK